MARKGKMSSIRRKANVAYKKDQYGKTGFDRGIRENNKPSMYEREYKIVNGIKYSLLK